MLMQTWDDMLCQTFSLSCYGIFLSLDVQSQSWCLQFFLLPCHCHPQQMSPRQIMLLCTFEICYFCISHYIACTAATKIYPAILCNGFPVLSSSLTTVTKSEFIAQFAWCSSECHRNVTKVIALHSNPDSVGFPQYQALIKVQERKWGKTLCSKGIFFTMLTIKNAWDLGRSNSHQDQRPRPFYIF